MRILITRAEPAASRTADKLIQLGFEPVSLPIFELVDLRQEFTFAETSEFIFTSANAAEILVARGWRPESANARAWCVGKNTGEAASNLGFENVETASGGGAALASLIKAAGLAGNTPFAYPTTPDRSFDMKEALSEMGLLTSSVDLYKVRKCMPDEKALRDFFELSTPGAILIYSDRSAEHFLDILTKLRIRSGFERFSVVSISQSAANIMLNLPWQGVYVSNSPNEASMFSRLEGFR